MATLFKNIVPTIYKNRLFFGQEEGFCYDLEYHYQYMKNHNIETMDVFLAQREVGSPYFFCQFFYEAGERGGCDSDCEGYKARNKKSGVCKHFGYTYERTNLKFTLKIKLND